LEFRIFRILFYRVFLAFYFSRGSPLLCQIAPLAMLKLLCQSFCLLADEIYELGSDIEAIAPKLLRQNSIYFMQK